eukprot:TRINITY_DN25868_c0_g1_i3.p1 TRINITY_DN25868_c0_g1~~TRINITY_DN25868_c0_g1_i3.p1  ORF type:complete len:160 (+),score=45.31 TRINITY_DN25868_c0_g1_i3:160-639(+)
MGMVTEQFKREVDELQKMVSTVEILSNPGLKQRHWEEIQEMLHTSFDWETVSLKDIMARGAEQFKEQLTEISDLASKEFKLEKTLQKMKTEWAKQEKKKKKKKKKKNPPLYFSFSKHLTTPKKNQIEQTEEPRIKQKKTPYKNYRQQKKKQRHSSLRPR